MDKLLHEHHCRMAAKWRVERTNTKMIAGCVECGWNSGSNHAHHSLLYYYFGSVLFSLRTLLKFLSFLFEGPYWERGPWFRA